MIRAARPREHDSRRIHFGRYAEHYQRAYVAILKPASRAAFGCYLRRHLVPHLAVTWLHEIDLSAVQQLIAHLAGLRLARGTIRGVVNLLRRMLSRAALEGYAATPIGARAVTLPKLTGVEYVARSFSASETSAILAAAAEPWATLYAIYAHMGLRAGEALGLTWAHVDFERSGLLVRQSANRGQIQSLKSRNSRADLPMPEELVKRLVAYRKIWKPNVLGLLFANRRGEPLWSGSVRRDQLAPLLQRLGIEHAGLHAWRHALASDLFRAGVGAPAVKAFLRHGDIATTLRYSRTTLADLRAAISALGAMRGKARKAAPASRGGASRGCKTSLAARVS